jgi:drug/metabolite transporter (DMT)-like permease
MSLTEGEREFVLAEYSRLGAELTENESMGEGRVTLYLGVWSAVLAAVGSLLFSEEKNPDGVRGIVFAALFVVLLLGVVSIKRVLKRNHHTDELIDALVRLRGLLNVGPEVQRALPWSDESAKSKRSIWDVGLLQILVITNSIVPAVAVLYVWPKETWYAPLTAGAALIVHGVVLRAQNEKAHSHRLKKRV